jgi:hypothetical protein
MADNTPVEFQLVFKPVMQDAACHAAQHALLCGALGQRLRAADCCWHCFGLTVIILGILLCCGACIAVSRGFAAAAVLLWHCRGRPY